MGNDIHLADAGLSNVEVHERLDDGQRVGA